MPNILTQLRIDEVSAVDRGAGEGVKIVLMKRDDTGRSQERQERSFNAIMAKAEADDGGNDGGGSSSDQNTGLADHPIVQLATLLVASGSQPDLASALFYLLNKPSGQALLARMYKAADQPAAKESKMDTIYSIMKDGSIAGTCAAIVQKGSTTISEQEIVEAVTKIAAERWPALSEAQAFSKIYTDQGAEGRLLREAIAIAKAMPLQVGGVDAVREANDATEQSKAFAQLQQIGRDRWPTATEAVQFANAMTDQKNAVLAQKAHRRPSATTSFQFPR
jgi:hypothetical protein